MPADLSLIMHATERDASKPAPERTRNRLPERCFPNPWRTDKAEDLSLAFLIQLTSSANKLLAQLAYGQELNDTLFDPFQPIMILIKNAARQLDIKSIVAAFCPGQSQHPIDIRAYHTSSADCEGVRSRRSISLRTLTTTSCGIFFSTSLARSSSASDELSIPSS